MKRKEVKQAGTTINHQAEAELQAALLFYVAERNGLDTIASAPAGEIKWECAWHQQYFQCRAWYGDNHVPAIAPSRRPARKGICLECAKQMRSTLGGKGAE